MKTALVALVLLGAITSTGCTLATADTTAAAASTEPQGSDDQALWSLPLSYSDVRIGTLSVPADGYTKVPVLALARLANGAPSLESIVLRVTRADAGALTETTVTLGALGSATYFTPCNGVANPSCLGAFQITMARASSPNVVVARTPVIHTVAPAGVGSAAACLTGGNVVFLDGDSGDFIHPGMAKITQGTFYANSESSYVGVSVQPSDQSLGSWWTLDFATTNLQRPIGVGVYDGAERHPFESSNTPGLDVDGDGRGCNTLSGRFEIQELSVDASGAMQRFTATFEQHCERWPATLRGCVHYEK